MITAQTYDLELALPSDLFNFCFSIIIPDRSRFVQSLSGKKVSSYPASNSDVMIATGSWAGGCSQSAVLDGAARLPD